MVLQRTRNVARSYNSTLNRGWWWIDQNKLDIAGLPENSISFALKSIDIMILSIKNHSLATVKDVWNA